MAQSKELQAISRMERTLEALNEDERKRVLSWLTSKYCERKED